eukprot:gene26546-biopygen16819
MNSCHEEGVRLGSAASIPARFRSRTPSSHEFKTSQRVNTYFSAREWTKSL